MSDQPPSHGPPAMPAGDAAPATELVLLASSRDAIVVQRAGIEVSLTPEPEAAGWLAQPAAGGGHSPAIRMLVTLEHVRGTNDATVLRVFLRSPAPSQGEAAETFLASAGLYGLRRASASGAGDGLQCQLDVTSHAGLLMQAMRNQAAHLVLAIRPPRPLPQGTAISIERIRLSAEKFE